MTREDVIEISKDDLKNFLKDFLLQYGITKNFDIFEITDLRKTHWNVDEFVEEHFKKVEEKNLIERIKKQKKMLLKRINDLEWDNDCQKSEIKRLNNTNKELKAQINEIIDCIRIDLDYTPCNCTSCKFMIKSYKQYHVSDDNSDMRKFGEKDKCVLNPRLMNLGGCEHIGCPLKKKQKNEYIRDREGTKL